MEVSTKAEREITWADDALYRSIKGAVAGIYAVGHCLAPRKLRDSIWDGACVRKSIRR